MRELSKKFQKKAMRRRSNRLLAGVLCISMILSAFAGIFFVQPKKAQAEEQEKMLSNPRIVKDASMAAGQKVTWDCIWFGSYPQAEVVPANKEYAELSESLLQEGDLIKDDVLYQKLESATGWDEQGDIVMGADKYRRIKKENATYSVFNFNSDYYRWKNEMNYHYFKYQPIKWRILFVHDSEAFLLSDKALDNKPYPTVSTSVTWESSAIRSWLNGYDEYANHQNQDYSRQNFINAAFNESAQMAIKSTKVENQGIYLDVEGENDTLDKVFLLSETEVYTDIAKKYGFVSDYNNFDEARLAKSSLYAKAMGIASGNAAWLGNCSWWLRGSGYGSQNVRFVNWTGAASRYYDDDIVYLNGMRPALNLNLATLSSVGSSNLWSYAGTVCSDGTVKETGGEVAGETTVIPGKVNNLYSAEVISDAYGVTHNKWTREGEVYHQAKNLVKAYNDYVKVIKTKFQADCRKTNAASNTYKELRKYDESAKDRKTNQLITLDSDAPDEAVDDTYEVLYDFLKKCLETGVSEKIIDLGVDASESPIKIEAKIINKIYDEIKSNSEGFYGTGKNGYTVQLKTVGIFGISFGGLTVTGGKSRSRTFKGTFCSDGKLVSQVMNQYIEDLSTEVKKLYKEAALSLWNEFRSVTMIDDISESLLKDYMEDKADYLLQKGYGKLAGNLLKMKKLDALIKKISSAKDSDSFFKVLQSQDWKNVYQEIKNVQYSDKEIKDALVGNAMEKVESARKNIEKAFFDYLYNDNTMDDMNFIEKTQYFWKLIWQCPVDVCIYSEDGKLLGIVSESEGVVSYTDDIYMELNGDMKTVYLPKDKKVSFKLLGTDEGSMNYIMEEYQDGVAVARLNYYNVPLTKGIEYNQSIETDVLSDNTIAMPLVQENGSKIEADEYILGTDKTKNVTINGTVEGEGVIYGEGKYAMGDAVELTAISDNDEYCFMGWYEDGMLAECDAVYRFTALKDVKVTALFERIPQKATDYIVETLGIYKENGRVVLYKNKENTANVIISVYDEERASDRKVTMKKYATDGSPLGISESTAIGDGAFRFILSDVLLDDWNSLELFDENSNAIAMIRYAKGGESELIPTLPPADSISKPLSPSPIISPTVKPSATPNVASQPEATSIPIASVAPSVEPTIMPEVSAEPSSSPEIDDSTPEKEPVKNPKKGVLISDSKTKAVYKITEIGKNKTVKYIRSTKKNTYKIIIPAKVKLEGSSYKVTSIAKNAFRNNKKTKSITIGKNVMKIGSKAFYGCKNIKNITIKTTKLTKAKIGSKAFKGIYSRVNIKVPIAKLKSYKGLLRAKGVGKSAKIHI